MAGGGARACRVVSDHSLTESETAIICYSNYYGRSFRRTERGGGVVTSLYRERSVDCSLRCVGPIR